MPAFTAQYIENLKPDGKFHPDEGGKKSVPGLYVYAGRKATTYYLYIGRGRPKEKLGTHPGYTIEKAQNEAIKKLGKVAEAGTTSGPRGRIKRSLRRQRWGLTLMAL